MILSGTPQLLGYVVLRDQIRGPTNHCILRLSRRPARVISRTTEDDPPVPSPLLLTTGRPLA